MSDNEAPNPSINKVDDGEEKKDGIDPYLKNGEVQK